MKKNAGRIAFGKHKEVHHEKRQRKTSPRQQEHGHCKAHRRSPLLGDPQISGIRSTITLKPRESPRLASKKRPQSLWALFITFFKEALVIPHRRSSSIGGHPPFRRACPFSCAAERRSPFSARFGRAHISSSETAFSSFAASSSRYTLMTLITLSYSSCDL